MAFEITNYSALLLFLLAVPIYYFTRHSLADLSPIRLYSALAVRFLLLALLILALANFRVIHYQDKLCVLFVLDVSKSISAENKEKAVETIKKSLKTMKKNDMAGLIVYGEDAYLDVPPSAEPLFNRIATITSTGNTDIARAIRLALASFPENTAKRIILFTDGNETQGSVLDEAVVARSNKTQIFTYPLITTVKKEVLLERIILPSKVKAKEPFEIKAIVNSYSQSKGKLKVFADGDFIAEKEVDFNKGKNVFVLQQTLNKSGFHTFNVQVESKDDTFGQNNQVTAFTQVEGTPKILYLSGYRFQTSLPRLLEKSGLDVEVKEFLPHQMTTLQNYDTLILDNYPALKMSKDQLKLLKSYVQDLGGGLIMLGGENSFGVGGYYQTPLEDALPVSMDIRKKKIIPSLGLILLVDKSGSMSSLQNGVEKMELAKEGAIACVDLLAETDKIGVIAFDGSAKTIVSFQKAVKKKVITDEIATLRAGGGTNLYPALEEATQILRKDDSILKHIIILSDGVTISGDFRKLAVMCRLNKITISTVAIGQDADIPFMRDLAIEGKGRFYYTEDVNKLPQIFTKDTLIASRFAMVEETFQPVLAKYSEVLKGVELKTMPKLKGYVTTVPKDKAEVLFVSHKKDPLLALWHYGLGKSIAFTSDSGTRWATSWLNWSGYGKLWPQAVRWSLRQKSDLRLHPEVKVEKGKGTVTVDAYNIVGDFLNFLDLKAYVVKEDYSREIISLKQTAPGRYQGDFDAGKTGVYLVTVVENEQPRKTIGTAVSYPAEYQSFEPNYSLLQQICEITGGKYNPPLQAVFQHSAEKVKIPSETWLFLLKLALILLPLDIAIRRVSLPENFYANLKQKIKIKLQKKVKKEEKLTSPFLDSLKKTKAEVSFSREKKEKEAVQLGVMREKLKPIPVEQDFAVEVQVPEKTSLPVKETPTEEKSYLSHLLKVKKEMKDNKETN